MLLNLICGDAFLLLPALEEKVQCVITDPPYFVLEKQKWDQQWQSLENYLSWTKKWWSMVWSVMDDNSSAYIFWSQKYLREGIEIFNPKRVLIWYHPNLAKPTNKMYLYTYDPIFYIEKGKPKFHAHFCGRTNVDVLTYSKPQSNWKGNNKRRHPAGKPVKLIKTLLYNSTNKEDLVLDPFMGSGTTAVACKQMNRKFIGFEINFEYYTCACNWLREVK